MPIRLICICGRAMDLPEKYAGEHVQCMDCRAMLHIPTAEEEPSLMRFFCACGQRLKARQRTAGKTVTCPRCRQKMTVPVVEAQTSFIDRDFIVDEASGILHPVRESADDMAVEPTPTPVPPPSPAPQRATPRRGKAAEPVDLLGDDETNLEIQGAVPIEELVRVEPPDAEKPPRPVAISPAPMAASAAPKGNLPSETEATPQAAPTRPRGLKAVPWWFYAAAGALAVGLLIGYFRSPSESTPSEAPGVIDSSPSGE